MSLENTNCPKMPWMIDFHSTDNGQLPNQQMKAVYATNVIDYMINLNMNSKTSPCRLTVLICTINESCCDVDSLIKMMSEGMSVAKLNMSFLNEEKFLMLVEKIRSAVDIYSEQIGTVYPLAIAMDTRGFTARTGCLQNPYESSIELISGEFIQVTTNEAYKNNCTDKIIYIDCPQYQKFLRENDLIYLDGDKIVLQVIKHTGQQFVDCVIKFGGRLNSTVIANAPSCPITVANISDADKSYIKLAAEHGIDAIFISNVDVYDTVYKVRLMLGQAGARKTLIFAKIESVRALYNIDLIIKACDGLVVCRNTISSELPIEKRFLVQRQIVGSCLKAGKPVFCPTEVFSLNMERPTRAECSDTAGTINEGITGLLMAREVSRKGEYTIKALQYLNQVALEAESAIYQKQLFENLIQDEENRLFEHVYVIAMSCVHAAFKSNAAAIILVTTSGRTAKVISHYRPRCPIIAITRLAQVARTLNFYRGVKPIQYLKPPLASWRKDINERFQAGITYGKLNGWIKGGATLILVQGYLPGSGHTNVIRIVYASDFDESKPSLEGKPWKEE